MLSVKETELLLGSKYAKLFYDSESNEECNISSKSLSLISLNGKDIVK